MPRNVCDCDRENRPSLNIAYVDGVLPGSWRLLSVGIEEFATRERTLAICYQTLTV